ncbi:MAG: deoxyribodipyrimidine photo-lyase [Candidatus Krumholzibacteria bacterium]|nr:deoxyribodipyrimidine photo-lyase [Candidatus Krumholzibacteria bacterium]
MPTSAIIVWFRRDLRLLDNPALSHACQSGRPVVPVFVLEDWLLAAGPEGLGAASRWWLHQQLADLAQNLAAKGLPLILRRGPAGSVLAELAGQCGAREVVWNRLHEPETVRQDSLTADHLHQAGLETQAFADGLMAEPGCLLTGSETPFQVFTPFYRKFRQTHHVAEPLASPTSWKPFPETLDSLDLPALGLEPKHSWAEGLKNQWPVGEEAARQRWEKFRASGLQKYVQQRDIPGCEGTSRLSCDLHFGAISVKHLWHQGLRGSGAAAEDFLRQLVWREFAHHLLHHYPHTTTENLRPSFANFAWDGDPALLQAWQRGQTGYPLVDAGMRQLWTTGWMHNRVRMVVASFLVKHLLLPWQWGAAFFQETLVDYDCANNTFGWQWSAGCGADAAPFFRIFNPTLQSRKFDPEGQYIRRWVPELKDLPAKILHDPASTSAGLLKNWDFELGRDYPHPVVDHKQARQRALDSYRLMRERSVSK